MANGLVVPDPDEALEPDMAMVQEHLARLQKFLSNELNVLLTVELRRSTVFGYEMHGFMPSQKVFWSRRDSSYGQAGVVVGPSDEYDSPCVLVQFRSVQFHCRVAHLSITDPKTLKRKAKRVAHVPITPKSAAHATSEDDKKEADHSE